jgi:hypothetical protein
MADKLTGAARAVLGQGLAMGWGDEAEAWLRSKLGQGSYEQNLSKIQQEYGEYSKESPFVSGALEFAGGAAPGVAAMLIPGGQPAGAAQLQRSTMGALGRMAGLGAATGAVSGAGSAKEGERLSGAGQGAALGAAIGAAAPLAIRSVGGASKWLLDRVAPTEARIQTRAAEKLNAALQESNLSPQDIAIKMAQDRAMRVPSVTANVSPALSDLAEAVAQRTGSGARKVEKTLTEQKTGARERTYSQVKKGLQPGDYYADEQKLVQDLRDRAKTLYDNAYAHGTVDDPRINTVLKDPEFAGFFAKAKEIANKEAMAAKLRGEDPSRYQLQEIYQLGRDPAGNTIVISTQLPDVRTLDYMKRGIDATIDSMYSTGKSAEATALRDLRKQFVNAIDENVGAYKQARGAYAGEMEVIDAMRSGLADFGKLDHEQIVKLVAGMSQAEKEAYRTGVARNLYSRIMDPSGNFNAAQRVIGSPEMQTKLQPLFDNPGQFQLFKNALEREAQLFGQANKVLGGSQTGKRTQMREQLEENSDIAQAFNQAASGNFWQSLTGLASRTIGKASINEKTASKMADMLMSKDPHEVAAVVQLLEKQAAGAPQRALGAGAVEAGTTTGTAGAVWPAPSPESAPADIEADANAVSPVVGPDIEADIAKMK